MSDARPSERAALNWRGPLLCVAIFAIAFGILLAMAHQNRSNASDEGSSLRQDSYGSSLLFDSYQRAGYRVERSQDEMALSERDASRTTAFFVGGDNSDDIETRGAKLIQGGKFHALLEDFLEQGGRVVLIGHDPDIHVAPVPGGEEKQDSPNPKWQNQNTWGIAKQYAPPGGEVSGPVWASPISNAMPTGSEMMYLAADSPWLTTDAGWTALYMGPAKAAADSEAEGDSPRHVYLAMRQVEKGELVVASQESFLLNEAIKTHPNPALLDFLAGGRSVIWVDETLHGLHQDQGVLWLVGRYRLQAALLLFWATLLALLWSMGGDLVRRPARHRAATIRGEAAGLAAQRLLRRSVTKEQVVAECWQLFSLRAAQDAQAISADPHWGPRLRAALIAPPLEGYKELAKLIEERRASAKGAARSDTRAAHPSSNAPNTISEEVRTA